MSGHIIVSTTTDSRAIATAITDAVLSKKLAACVQAMPIASSYMWDGTIVRTDELLLLVKARAEDYAAIEAEITARHGYSTPQITAVSITDGSAAYLDWIDRVTMR